MSKLSYIIILLVIPRVLHAADSPSPAPASTSSPALVPTPASTSSPSLVPTPSPSPSSPIPSSPTPNINPPLDSSQPPQQLSPPPLSKSAKSSSKGRTGKQKAGIAIGVLAATGLLVFGGMVYKTRRNNIRRARRAQMSSAARRTAP